MSDLVTGQDAPNFRVVSGTVQVIEHLLNQLLNDYAAFQWFWCVLDGQVIVSVALMHTRIIARQQLAAARMPGMRQ